MPRARGRREDPRRTVHFVVPEMDAGPIIAQAAVPVLPATRRNARRARAPGRAPHLSAGVAAGCAEGKLQIVDGRCVVIDGASDIDGVLISPSNLRLS